MDGFTACLTKLHPVAPLLNVFVPSVIDSSCNSFPQICIIEKT
ncbi:hypothetical protein HNQ53_002485 [Microbulbifer hydrolyticus]|uniref:Uncharacterized protein n=1 Tax=Microbulbifer hydrolyticus TaxID=48074 RepID=A0AA89T6C9_9GAMM|nr:hypothetical protein [Microbulbifer hydrolyticus]